MSTIKRLIFALFTIFFVSWAVPAMAAIEPVFTVTTTNMPAGTMFSFAIKTPGTYYIDWGDGSSVQTITSTGTITHTFANGGVNTIGIAGGATGQTAYPAQTISFTSNSNIASLGGSLGALFPTVGENAPTFLNAFYGCTNLTTIPSTLFSGVTKSAPRQFSSTFSSSAITSIPDGLFADLDDDAATSQFQSTFAYCYGLTGSIPATLFSGVKSTAENLFDGTFGGCSGLTGEIPATLFATVKGEAKSRMFADTFNGCKRLTGSIPATLFSGVKSTAHSLFQNTFSDCSGLTGSIPATLFATVNGDAKPWMFANTFLDCSGLTGSIPADLFSTITGAPQEKSFYQTFCGASGLTGTVPTTLFATLYNENYASGPMQYVFYDTGLATACPVGTYQYTTGFEVDFDGKVACAPCPAGYYCPGGTANPIEFEPKFTVTTTNMPAGTVFEFAINATGTYYIDWGDGSPIETITSPGPITYTFENGGVNTIGIAGGATATGQTAYPAQTISFAGNGNIASVDGSLGDLFPTVGENAPAFQSAFANCTNLTTIPSTLFSGVTKSANYQFSNTFSGCTSLTSIPDGLFADLDDDAATSQFQSTFSGCSGLTGSIPAGLFAGVKGNMVGFGMFQGTFLGCSGLTGSIPADLFGGLDGNGARSGFEMTFSGCSGLTGSIPATLFSGVKSTAESLFSGTFWGCKGLNGSIPSDLFASLNGSAPANKLFNATFISCSGLTGEIPEDLFASVQGEATSRLFYATFSGCSGLEGEIPAGLFRTISGPIQAEMFYSTFQNCSKLSGEIPADLFSTFTGKPQSQSFLQTFSGCSGLTGTVPTTLFETLDNTDYTSGPMKNIFYNTGLATACPVGTYQYMTGFEVDFNGRVACAPCPDGYYCPEGTTEPIEFEPEFSVTTTDMATGTVFEFAINAPGTYYIDWGDGSPIETITNTGTITSPGPITYTFENGGVNTIGIAGGATGQTAYPASVISFEGNSNIASLGGSLGALFPTVGENAPAFRDAFKGCSNLTAIPSTLFSGVTKSADKQFNYTFSGCSSLTSIPDGLFADLNDDGAEEQFEHTFSSCTGLTGSIPATLFSGVKSTAQGLFYATFNGCSGLTGSIPATLFATVKGDAKQSMFGHTFSGCTGLTGSIPADLFSGVTSTAEGLFQATFSGCTGLKGEIPATLFATVNGDAKQSMFSYTFNGCTGLTGSIPGTLFSGVKSTAENLFNSTFQGCKSLTGSIPADLFSSITSTADSLFSYTFFGCTGLTGEIPATLFATVNGDAKKGMFQGTFVNCSGLTGSIPADLFSTITGAPQERSFFQTFYGASGLTGTVPTTLFESLDNTDYTSGPMQYVFSVTGLATACPVGTYQFMTGFEVDFDGKVACAPCPENSSSVVGSTECTCNAGYSIGADKTTIITTQEACVANTYTATFDCGTDETESINWDITYGNVFVVPLSDTCSKPGYALVGWRTDDTLYTTDQEYTWNFADNKTFTAQWEQTIVACQYGMYYDGEKFTDCPAGVYCPYDENTSVQVGTPGCFVDCPAGYDAAPGAVSERECAMNVPAGYYLTSKTDSVPTICPKGYYCPGGTELYDDYLETTKSSCSMYGYADDEGLAQCKICPVRNNWGAFTASPQEHKDNDGVRDDITDCTYGFIFAEQWYLELFGADLAANYDPNNQLNRRGLFTIECRYNSDTDNYDTDCYGAYVGYCATDYYSPLSQDKVSYEDASNIIYENLNLDTMENLPCQPVGDGWTSIGLTANDTSSDAMLASLKRNCAAGYYGDGTTCTICPAGSYCPQGATEPTACPENSYSTDDGAGSCKCNAGYSVGGDKTTTTTTGAACVANTYTVTYIDANSAENRTETATYGAQYTISSTHVEKEGYVQTGWRNVVPYQPSYTMGQTITYDFTYDLMLSPIYICAAGYYGDGNTCTICPAGSYCPEGSTAPNACPENSSTNGATGMQYCTCDTGYSVGGNVSTSTTTQTTACLINKYSVVYWRSATPGGVPLHVGSLTYGGTYTMWEGPTYDDKKVNVWVNQSTFKSYKPGSTLTADEFTGPSLMVYPLYTCKAGYYGDGTTCTICPAGSYCPENVTTPTPCPVGSYCLQGATEPITCPESHKNTDGIASTGITNCYVECDAKIDVVGGIAFCDNDKEYYDNKCTYSSGQDSFGNKCDVVDGVCVHIECLPEYEMKNGVCVPCARKNALSYNENGNCRVESCVYGFHPNDDQCEKNVIDCTEQAPNAIAAERVWNSASNSFGLCTITQCVDGYHVDANACVADARVCKIENGIGEQVWDEKRNRWDDCIATKCEPGYTNDPSLTNENWKQCGRCNNMFGVNGERAASSYITECEIASCMYQGEKYILENNECRLICDHYSDETGRRYWEDGKCIHKCTSGYLPW